MTAWIRAARGARGRQATAHPLAEPPRETAEGRRQKAVLVSEIVRDEPRRDPRATCDLSQSAADVADFSQTIDSHRDELQTPLLLWLVGAD